MNIRPALLADGFTVLGRLTLPGRADHVREARRLVARTLRGLHPRAEDAALLTSELMTNAVLHSRSALPGGSVEVTVLESAAGVRVEVADSGSELTAPLVRGEVQAAGGRGLFLVQSLADQWGYYRRDESGTALSGTTVWFTLKRG